jgi:UPF0716 protein FxsA
MRVLVGLLITGVVEIGLLILVGREIGAVPVLLLLIAGMALGSWLLRRQGRRAFREFTGSAFARRLPPQELADGVISAAGAALLMVPGFLSDLAGILCLLPPTRAVLRRRLRVAAQRRVHEHIRGTRPGNADNSADYVDGEVVSVTEDTDEEHPKLDSTARREDYRD